MRLFQLIALPFIAVMLALTIRNLFKQPARLAMTLFWAGLWSAALYAVIYPDATSTLARALGIHRGADLLIYSAVLGSIVAFYVVSLRMRQLSREMVRY